MLQAWAGDLDGGQHLTKSHGSPATKIQGSSCLIPSGVEPCKDGHVYHPPCAPRNSLGRGLLVLSVGEEGQPAFTPHQRAASLYHTLT